MIEYLQSMPDFSTVSPYELTAPSAPFTPSTYTPSLSNPTPQLTTPGPGRAVLAAAAHASSAGRKRTSPLSDNKSLSRSKRSRSEEEADQAAKRRKHTGTRPGINSTQLIAPGAPPQPKTYLTESSTSRKDVPTSYKMKPGDLPDDSALSKIVAKRTANRDSARRSRMRKQAAIEQAQRRNDWYTNRVHQLEEFIRQAGLPVPEAAELTEVSMADFDEEGD